MHFANPIWLWLLIPVIGVCGRMILPRIRPAIPYARTQSISRHKSSWRMLLYYLMPWIFLVVLLLLVLAMARPRRNLSEFRREANAISIMVVVDVSGSMEALDLSRDTEDGIEYLTRLDVVKDVFSEFIDYRPDDLIGLISFGGYASVLSPLTLDHNALRQILDTVDIPPPFHDPSSGAIVNEDERMTAIGDALALASSRLREAETESRIIVLLSDGLNNAGILEPMQAARIAKELGLRVYTIGVGTTGYAPVRITDAAGRQSMRYAYIEIDERALQDIADLTGGVYFNTLDEEGLSRALEAINELETTPVQQQILERFEEHYRSLILTALILLCACVLVNVNIKRNVL